LLPARRCGKGLGIEKFRNHRFQLPIRSDFQPGQSLGPETFRRFTERVDTTPRNGGSAGHDQRLDQSPLGRRLFEHFEVALRGKRCDIMQRQVKA
jgi:hypothetical protein